MKVYIVLMLDTPLIDSIWSTYELADKRRRSIIQGRKRAGMEEEHNNKHPIIVEEWDVDNEIQSCTVS